MREVDACLLAVVTDVVTLQARDRRGRRRSRLDPGAKVEARKARRSGAIEARAAGILKIGRYRRRLNCQCGQDQGPECCWPRLEAHPGVEKLVNLRENRVARLAVDFDQLWRAISVAVRVIVLQDRFVLIVKSIEPFAEDGLSMARMSATVFC